MSGNGYPFGFEIRMTYLSGYWFLTRDYATQEEAMAALPEMMASRPFYDIVEVVDWSQAGGRVVWTNQETVAAGAVA